MYKHLIKKTFLGVFVIALVPSCGTFQNQHSAKQERFFSLIEDFDKTPTTSLNKIDQLTESLMGIPYVDGNLGEGAEGQYDQDPLMRFDAFDCTTYVETIIAGTQAHDTASFLEHLKQIRYQDGNVSFVTRNHFPSVDWIPNNQHILQEITADVGGKQTLYAHTTIDKRAWYQAMTMDRIQTPGASTAEKSDALLRLKQEGAQFEPEAVNTPYIPLSAIFVPHTPPNDQVLTYQAVSQTIKQDETLTPEAREAALQKLALRNRLENSHINQALLDRIPSGSVISIVRPDYDVKQWIGTNMNITHQAIALRRDGILYLRHASQLQREVIEQPFVEYFSHYVLSPTVKGFNIQTLRP